MADLYIAKTRNTPMIQVDRSKGIIHIKGSSIPEDAVSFYEPLLNEMKLYCDSPRDTIVNMDLPYYNSATSRIFQSFFKLLADIMGKVNVTVNWYYDPDDEDFKDAANVYATLTKVPFNLVERKL